MTTTKLSLEYPLTYWLTLILSVSLLIFIGINAMPIMLWDESRNAVNAYEMYKNGWSLHTTFLNEGIDNWNTKPPLLIYLQVFFMHIIGVNEWAMRLPSVLAGVITCCLVAHWVKRETQSPATALFSAIILATSLGFNGVHVVRTGDYDALLVMWTVAAAYSFYNYLQKNNTKSLLYFALFISAAVLTKSVMGIFILPALGIYTLVCGKLLYVIKDARIYLSIILTIILIGSYYLMREHHQLGYLQIVYQNELGGRFNESLEIAPTPFYYYLRHFRMPYWVIFLPLIILSFKEQYRRYQKFTTLAFLIIICHLGIISSAQTKHTWYDAMIYPFVAMLMAVSLKIIHDKYASKWKFSNKISWPFLIIALSIVPIFNTIKRNLNPPKNKDIAQQVSLYLKHILEGKTSAPTKELYMIPSGYVPQDLFYVHSDKNPDIQVNLTILEEVQPHQHIITNDSLIVDIVNKKFDVTFLEKRPGLYHILTSEQSTVHQ